jgi:hypothetical protein
MLGPHRLDIDGRMVGPSHMILQVSPVRVAKGHNPKKEKTNEKEARKEGAKTTSAPPPAVKLAAASRAATEARSVLSSHRSPYDPVRDVNVDP